MPTLELWSAYVLVAEDGRRTYVGISSDVARRLEQHNGTSPGGAKTTRNGRPWRIAAVWGPFADRGSALSAEYRIKRLRGPDRLRLANRASLGSEPMAWKKIPKEHHELFYAAMPGDTRADLMKMFGGIAIIVNGNMAGGLWEDSVVVRLAPDQWARAAKRGGQPFVPIGTRVMKDMILLPKGTLNNKEEIGDWLQLSIDYTATMPPKRKKAKKAAAKKPAAAKKAAAKKATAKKTAAKKTAAKKMAGKKPAKPAAAKKTAAKPAAAKKTAAKTVTAKKPAAKKPAPKKRAAKK